MATVAVPAAVVWISGAVALSALGRHPNAETFDPDRITYGFGPGAYWDTVWFVNIANDGYDNPEAPAFFPLYPLLVRIFGTLTGSDVLGGLLVSVACFAGALYLLYRLVALDFGERVAWLTAALVAVFPFAAYFFAVYSESLFLLLSVGAIYAARLDRWALAGVVGALACATRSAGIVLIVPLGILWWQQRGRGSRDLAWVALVPLGIVAFCAYLTIVGQDTFGPFGAQEAWGRTFAGPLGGVIDGADHAWAGARQIINGEERTWMVYDTATTDVTLFVELVLVVIALALAFRRLPFAYWAYAVAALSIPLSYPSEGQPLMSLPRFVAVLWPLHLWLALVLVDRPLARRVVLGVSLVGLAVISARVATWRWVG